MSLKLIPLGGLGEIGMNCLVLEYGDEIVVVDCGLLFTDLDEFGIDFVIPNLNYLIERKDRVKGFVVTHGHEDHIGAIPFAYRAGIRAPIYASEFSSRLVEARLEDRGQAKGEIRTFRLGDEIAFKHFKFKTVPVNHSIIESVALMIDTPVGKIVHTGDFKIDPDPFYGDRMDLDRFRAIGDEGVLLLLSDSTNIERQTDNPAERTVYENLLREFEKSKGLSIVTMFASNVARMGQIMELAQKLNRKVILAGRSVGENFRIAGECGYLEGAESVVIDVSEMENYDRDKLIVIATGSQGEFGSALRRISMGEHKFVKLEDGDRVLMSSRFIPGNELAINRVINELYRQGAEVLYESLHQIHASGHATRPDLKKMLEAVRPKYFIPIHGEYRHLVHHAQLARETGVEDRNSVVLTNGDVVELNESELKVTDHLEEIGTLIEESGNPISKEVLKQRRKIAESGVAFVAFQIDQRGKLKVQPQIAARGVCGDDVSSWLNEEAVRLLEEFIRQQKDQMPDDKLTEAVRIELRRFYRQNLGKKPIVIAHSIN